MTSGSGRSPFLAYEVVRVVCPPGCNTGDPGESASVRSPGWIRAVFLYAHALTPVEAAHERSRVQGGEPKGCVAGRVAIIVAEPLPVADTWRICG